uniref:C2H2-type domain-containing protein n=1 Tax=Biomphalaria glabrata TaxID=6526 RepID=A0A2C9L4Q4_BIOGL
MSSPEPSKFYSKFAYQRHKLAYCHKAQYMCLDCNKNFKTLKYTKQHMNLAHLQKKFYQCESCGKNFYSKFRFQRHKLAYCHKVQYMCLDCNKNFKTLKYMKQHMNGTQGTTNQSSQSIGPFKIQNRLNSNNYQSYRSQSKKTNNYGTSSQPKDNTDIPIASHNFTGSRKFLSDVVFQCQQRFPGTYPQFCNKKLERHCDMKKHLHSHTKSSELMSKYNTLRAARESNQSMTSFNMHKGVHLNEYPPKQIQIHQQAFRSHRGGQTMNMSAMRVSSKNHKAQLYYCQICLQSFIAESDLKRHLLLHGANEWQIHGQNYYIFSLGNENFVTSSSLNNHIDRHSVLTRLNQKLKEETTFPPLHWDAKAHVMPDCSSYGPDRVHILEGPQHGPDRVHNLQGLQHGPDRVQYLPGLQRGPERVHNLQGLHHGRTHRPMDGTWRRIKLKEELRPSRETGRRM